MTDGVTGASAEATTEVELVRYAEGAGFDDLEALSAWKLEYSADPDLQRVVPALWLHCRNDGFLASAEDQAADGFFLEILDANHWLFPELFEGLKKRLPAERRGALWLLAHSSAESEPFVKKLSKEDKALWAELSGAVRDPMSAPLRELHDVNELYGRYLASRRLPPLERLIRALHEDGEVVSGESVRDEVRGVDVPLKLVVAKVVQKLLGGLLASDPLARGYAEGLLRAGAFPAGVAAELTGLLAGSPR